MSPQPNWLVTVGAAKESVWGVPISPPTFYLSTDKPVFDPKKDPIYDRGLRGIRAETQAFTFGAGHTELSIPDMPWYGDDSGHLVMSMLGQDTLTGTARTGTIAAVAAGVTTLTYTIVTGSAPVVGDNIKLDNGQATMEIVTPTVVSGAGPYTLTVAATKYAHAAAAPAVPLFLHTLTLLNTAAPPSYTFAKFDNLVATAQQVTGCYVEQFDLKLANPGMAKCDIKARGKLPGTVTKGTAAYSAEPFNVPWQAAFTINGQANARVIDFSLTVKASNDQIFGMNATQSPTAAISDQLSVTGKATLVPDDYTEFNYFLTGSPQPAINFNFNNGSTISTFQMSQTALFTGVPDHSGNYTKLSMDFEAIANSTDGLGSNAPLRVVLANAKSAAY